MLVIRLLIYSLCLLLTGGTDTTTDTTTSSDSTSSTSSTASPSTTTTSTVSSTTTSGPCDDYNSNGICDVYENLRCEVAILTGTALTLAKIILLLSTIWVVIWSIATIVVNILHKNTGHHRWIHLVEELGIIILWIFMGVFNLTMRSNIFCTIVSVVIHYFAVMIATCFVFEAIFANSMVHNKQKKNGAIPPLLNYIIPLLLALVPSLVTYFTNKKYYGISGLHCFVITELPIMYAFVIPVWALVTIALWPSSLGNLACDVTSPEQDQRQCYWAKKSCKVLALLSFWFLFAYLTCMFGSNSQRLWARCRVLILFLVQSLIFGPLLFIAHTFCHVNTSSKWYRPSLPGRLYTPCFSSRPLPFIPPLEMPKQPPSPVKRQEPPRDEPVKDPQQSPTTSDSIFDLPDRQPTRKMIAGDHMVASDLWGWASTKGKEDRREDVVMGLRPY